VSTSTQEQLGPIGDQIVMENDYVRVWEVSLAPNQTQPRHRHLLPYLVVALEGSETAITNAAGEERRVVERTGDVAFHPPGETHALRNVGSTPYRNRLIEFKRMEYVAPALQQMSPDQLQELVLMAEDDTGWEQQRIPGLQIKMLWEAYHDGPSIALAHFAKGSSVPRPHIHASNQYMYCLKGKYAYPRSNIVLTPGMFYWNPKDHPHGPTEALEDSLLIEIYDGPHYYERPDFHGGTGRHGAE
jgi:quercetin dioxygenase-like cupin family protein